MKKRVSQYVWVPYLQDKPAAKIDASHFFGTVVKARLEG